MEMWMVMSAVTLANGNVNRDRMFKLNALNFPTEREANAEARRRNKKEKEAGHTNVVWYSCPQYNFPKVP
jgi:hypothetical protein